MNLLTVNTGAVACGLAVSRGETVVAEMLISLDRRLSERLFPSIEAILAESGMGPADLDGIGVSLGPGSFTSVRIGMAAVKGFALAAAKPVVGFSSLTALAANLPCASLPVCPMLDARKNEVYAALYDTGGPIPEALIPDCVRDPSLFLESLEGEAIFIGEGALRYKSLIEEKLGDRAHFAPFPCNQPRPGNGSLLALHLFRAGKSLPLALLNPAYIRPSEAEIARMNRL